MSAGTTQLVDRRTFGLGIAAFSAIALATRLQASVPAQTRNIVDVHAHFMPPDLIGTGVAPVMAAWTVQRHIDSMDEAGVTRSLLSITTPGVVAKGAEGARLVRRCNEYAANLVAKYSRRFGHFVYVRLDDPETALEEIAFGLDVLKANGVGLFTNYEGKWLGDPAYDQVFTELNRRMAIVYVHPTTGSCCRNLVPHVADTLIEYGTDTTRAIASFIYGGAAIKFPNVRMIWSHAGGTMPYLVERFDTADKNPGARANVPNGFRAAASRFFYDVAQASNPVATGALRKVVPVDKILFGTDYPFRTHQEHALQLETGGVFDSKELRALYRLNVAQELPELLI